MGPVVRPRCMARNPAMPNTFTVADPGKIVKLEFPFWTGLHSPGQSIIDWIFVSFSITGISFNRRASIRKFPTESRFISLHVPELEGIFCLGPCKAPMSLLSKKSGWQLATLLIILADNYATQLSLDGKENDVFGALLGVSQKAKKSRYEEPVIVEAVFERTEPRLLQLCVNSIRRKQAHLLIGEFVIGTLLENGAQVWLDSAIRDRNPNLYILKLLRGCCLWHESPTAMMVRSGPGYHSVAATV
ncbi:glutaminase [Moniliophthora roreri]|nr:glutaminase [Moniliophthora roreri]